MLVNPSREYPAVFIFSIEKKLPERNDIYEATRKYWDKVSDYQYFSDMIGIGLVKGIAKGVYRIKKWNKSNIPGYEDRYEFIGNEEDSLNDEFLGMDFSSITKHTGYWNFGNWLIVSFDGNGSFNFIRPGTLPKTYSCLMLQK